MNVVVITGSAHKNGTTATLAESFIGGAKEAGHNVFRFDAAYNVVHPCIGCEKCKTADGECVFTDDMKKLSPALLSADAVVFVSPIYYYDINAQIKAVIDRFYAIDDKLHGNKTTALMVALADVEETARGAVVSFENMANYLDWKIVKTLIAAECADAESLSQTNYLKQAFELGKKICK